MFDWQTWVALSIVACAATVLISRVVSMARSKQSVQGCHKCPASRPHNGPKIIELHSLDSQDSSKKNQLKKVERR
jgi:hypothetical protein